MYRETRKRKIIIFSLIGILLLMAIGYAVFQTNLDVKGNSQITSNWDVEIINVKEGEKAGLAESAKTPTWTKTEASMETNLYQKGDSKGHKTLSIIMTVLIILIIILIIVLCVNNSNDKKLKPEVITNTNEGIIKEEDYNGLVFNNVSLITEKGYTTFTASVTNRNSEVSNISDVNINFYDKDDNLIMSFRGNIGDNLNPGETRTITSSTKGNLNKASYKTITEYTQG